MNNSAATITGNYIGTNVTGLVPEPNTSDGIRITNASSTIGGFLAAERNVISGNNEGVEITTATATNNVVAGNCIGLGADGTTIVANSFDGIHLSMGASSNMIGGNAATAINVISGNGSQGVNVEGASTSANSVHGNRIGTTADGLAARGNGLSGVSVGNGATGNSVGGAAAEEGNLISGNCGAGVEIVGTATSTNSVIGNSIFSNGGLGIDLDNDGVTLNDADDVDTGPNDLLNFPVVTGAVESGGVVTVEFDLDVPAGDYRIEVFTNPSGVDPSGFGEGKTFRNTTTITHTGGGAASFQINYLGAAGDVITLTATEESAGPIYGATSEFSASVLVTGENTIVVANADPVVAEYETATIVYPSVNDFDVNGDTIDEIDCDLPSDGSLVDNGDGTFTYTPDNSFLGVDSFDYLAIDDGAGLTHHWALDGDAADSIGSLDGTLNGTTTVVGHMRNALAFDEIDDYVDIPDAGYATEFSVAFKFRIADNSGSLFQYMYSHGNINATNSVNVFLAESGHGTSPNMLRTVVRDDNDTLDNFALQTNIASLIGDGQWHSYLLTVSSTGLNVYVDGVEVASDATRGSDGTDPTGSVFVGARDDLAIDRFYGGRLDSLQIYERALASTEAADLAGDVNRGTVTITVQDTTVPVITLIGPNPLVLEVGTAYAEFGATALDNYDGDLSGSIIINSGAVNTAIVGSYSVTYDVTDTNGNNAVQVTRTVDVVDTTIPVITLVGANPQTIEVGTAYTELGATAADNYDGDLTGSIVIDATAVNTAIVGSYVVTYDVTDANGNNAVQVTRTVDVVDTTVPVITLVGANPQVIEAGTAYVELGATALDSYDGDIFGSIVIDATAVNTSVVGSYSVTYDVTDANGNAAIQVTRTVDVVDTTIPVIILVGANPQVIEVGSPYTELGATALDNYDGDISGSIVIDATAVNTAVVGSYSVTYDVTDANGNNAVQVTRTVDVVDTTLPVITLVGANP